MTIDPKAIPDVEWRSLLSAWSPYSELVSRPERFYMTISPVEPLACERSLDTQEGLLAVYKGKSDEGEPWKAFLRRDGDEHLIVRIEFGEAPRWTKYEVECGMGRAEPSLYAPQEHAKVGDLWVSLNETLGARFSGRDRADHLEASPRLLYAVAARIADQFEGECAAMALRALRASVGYRLAGLDRLRDSAMEAAAELAGCQAKLSAALKKLPSSLKRLRDKSPEELSVVKEYFVDGTLGVLGITPSVEGDTIAVRPTKRRSDMPNIGQIVLGWNVQEVAVAKDGRMSEVSFSHCSAEAGRKAIGQTVSRFVKDNPNCFQRAEIEELATEVVKAQAKFDAADGRLLEDAEDLGRSIERLALARVAAAGLPGIHAIEIPDLPEPRTVQAEPVALW